MKNLFYFLTVIIFCACNSKKTPNQVITATPTGIQGLQKNVAVIKTDVPAKSSLIFNPPHGQAGHSCDLAVGAPLNQMASAKPQQIIPQTTSTAKAVNQTGKNLNPAHGKPNHRCDIAVGATLDSKPAQKAIANQTVNVNTASSKKVAKGLNPAHGQPNHRCDIAVGKPLNSKPVQKAASINSLEVKNLEVSNGSKLNPKHGESGHRCDIAVGAPLT
ncbi:hypothetical protein [Pedobacter jamesrossensis]|uniref:Superoxide dismutase, Cu-Zn family n=1 Tax=Pedobacter jamesrossensis TaxID=1908238 RepID=A0ABV8NFF8_9SPHI